MFVKNTPAGCSRLTPNWAGGGGGVRTWDQSSIDSWIGRDRSCSDLGAVKVTGTIWATSLHRGGVWGPEVLSVA